MFVAEKLNLNWRVKTMDKPKTIDEISKQAKHNTLLLIIVMYIFFCFTLWFINEKVNKLETKIQCVESKNNGN